MMFPEWETIIYLLLLQVNLMIGEYHKIIYEEKEILFYCQTGRRSKQAAQIFQQLTDGKKKVYSLKGGLEAYKN